MVGFQGMVKHGVMLMVGKPWEAGRRQLTPEKKNLFSMIFGRKKSSSPTQFCVKLVPVSENLTRTQRFLVTSKWRAGLKVTAFSSPAFMGRWAPLKFT